MGTLQAFQTQLDELDLRRRYASDAANAGDWDSAQKQLRSLIDEAAGALVIAARQDGLKRVERRLEQERHAAAVAAGEEDHSHCRFCLSPIRRISSSSWKHEDTSVPRNHAAAPPLVQR